MFVPLAFFQPLTRSPSDAALWARCLLGCHQSEAFLWEIIREQFLVPPPDTPYQLTDVSNYDQFSKGMAKKCICAQSV